LFDLQPGFLQDLGQFKVSHAAPPISRGRNGNTVAGFRSGSAGGTTRDGPNRRSAAPSPTGPPGKCA
jgi:hypothetical protein